MLQLHIDYPPDGQLLSWSDDAMPPVLLRLEGFRGARAAAAPPPDLEVCVSVTREKDRGAGAGGDGSGEPGIALDNNGPSSGGGGGGSGSDGGGAAGTELCRPFPLDPPLVLSRLPPGPHHLTATLRQAGAVNVAVDSRPIVSRASSGFSVVYGPVSGAGGTYTRTHLHNARVGSGASS